MKFRSSCLALVVLGALVLPAAAFARPFQGTVGPGASIRLKRANGTNLRHTTPGRHRFSISDLSGLHNFHLVGPGLNKKTGIAFTGSRFWKVKLSAGTYKFHCDAHPTTMRGSFSVS
jgi:plastocyanin